MCAYGMAEYIRETLEMKIKWGSMKRLMEEATTGQIEVIHYSASVDI